MRDITVPIGTPTIRAISAYENSSTSRSQTAWRNASGSASSAACRSASSVSRVSSCSGVCSCAMRSAACSTVSLSTSTGLRTSCRRMFRNVLWRIVNSHALRFVPALELRRGAERLQIGLLNEVLGVGRPARQPQRGPVQAVHIRQRLARELVFWSTPDRTAVGGGGRPSDASAPPPLRAERRRKAPMRPSDADRAATVRGNTGRERLYSGRLYSMPENGDGAVRVGGQHAEGHATRIVSRIQAMRAGTALAPGRGRAPTRPLLQRSGLSELRGRVVRRGTP